MKMLAWVFGRKFDAKCKVWVRRTMERTEVLRKRSKATEKGWSNDIEGLLSRGWDTHAYSKAEHVFTERNQISCFDLMDQFCLCILNHLPLMQENGRECPEECKEAVASLIFAAGRISSAPELIKLRGILKERYKTLPESSVSQKFAAKFEFKSSSKEKKLEYLRDIAQRFDIIWDSRGLEQELSNIRPSSDQKISSGRKGAAPEEDQEGPSERRVPIMEMGDRHPFTDGVIPGPRTRPKPGTNRASDGEEVDHDKPERIPTSANSHRQGKGSEKPEKCYTT